jgi:hypothetical protein
MLTAQNLTRRNKAHHGTVPKFGRRHRHLPTAEKRTRPAASQSPNNPHGSDAYKPLCCPHRNGQSNANQPGMSEPSRRHAKAFRRA